MTQVEKDGGCSLSTLLEILCPVGSSLGQWDIRAQVALNQTLERIGYQGILPGMTREPLSTEITAQDARIALRAAAQLEALEGVFSQAADSDADSTVTATDARKILRIAAKLDPYPAI